MEVMKGNITNNNTSIKTESIIVGGMALVTLVTGAILSSISVNAETETVDEINITVPTACTMSGDIAAGQEHTASINPNTYQDNIGKTTITTFCNDAGGYAIYAIGYTGDQYTGDDHTKLIGTNTNQKISTGTAKTGTSQWAMRVTPVTGDYAPTIENDFDSADYHIIPDTYEKVAIYGNTTDAEGGTGSSIETTYAAYINGAQAADTYTGKVKYTLVHPSTEVPAQPQVTQAGKICYYANASDAVGTMGCQNVASSIDLLASNFSRTGYGFAGWSNKFDYATNTDSDLKFYGPQETITLNTADYTGTNNGLSLYAVWVKSQGSIQDTSKVIQLCGTGGVGGTLITAPTDGTANLSSVSALTDQRDNQTYAIAKLADGNCWMIENLRLESTAAHNSDGTLAQGYGTSATYGNFSGLADAESANFTSSTTANSLYYSGTQDGTATVDIGSANDPSYRSIRYNNLNTQSRAQNNPSSNTFANHSSAGGGMYSYGNYYTWHATIADTTYYSSGDHNTTSICPTGWMIPLGNTSAGDIEQGVTDTANKVGGFSYLDRKMGGTGATQYTVADSLRWRKYPINLLYSGYFNASTAFYRGSVGYYWSSTANSNLYSYSLVLADSSLNPGTGSYGNKYYGYSIRCLVGS